MRFFTALVLLVSCCALRGQQYCDGISNLSARCNPDCRSFDIFANLIVWTAREAGADCWAQVLTTTSSSSVNDLLEIDFKWDPGFRVGIGYGMGWDQWDTKAYYTWFHTKGKDFVSGLPGTVHSSFVGNFYVSNPNGLGLSGPSYERAHINWTIHFDMFDWDLGRNFWVSKSLALHPFAGLKGGWIHQSIHSVWENPAFVGPQFVNPQPFGTGLEKVKNHFSGIGPSFGINSKWNLHESSRQLLNLFGDFSGALMWGHWMFRDFFDNDIGEHISVGMQNINSGATTIRAFMGLGWEIYWNQWHLSTKLGYETQFWLNQLQYYSFIGGRLSHQLTLQGGTFEFAFDF